MLKVLSDASDVRDRFPWDRFHRVKTGQGELVPRCYLAVFTQTERPHLFGWGRKTLLDCATANQALIDIAVLGFGGTVMPRLYVVVPLAILSWILIIGLGWLMVDLNFSMLSFLQ